MVVRAEDRRPGVRAASTKTAQLATAATRGDGTRGENITPNVRTIRSIPHRRRSSRATLRRSLRGARRDLHDEAAASRSSTSSERRSGLPLFASPRNSAAGSVRQLDPNDHGEPPARRVLYQLGWQEGGKRAAHHWDALQWLKGSGFKVNPNIARFDRARRSDRASARAGSRSATRSTTRSTASSSRSMTWGCSGSWARSGASRAGRSPTSSRRRRRRRSCSDRRERGPHRHAQPVRGAGARADRAAPR